MKILPFYLSFFKKQDVQIQSRNIRYNYHNQTIILLNDLISKTISERCMLHIYVCFKFQEAEIPVKT